MEETPGSNVSTEDNFNLFPTLTKDTALRLQLF